jgi:unsaturated rhamnogalacturonyl hydrolase
MNFVFQLFSLMLLSMAIIVILIDSVPLLKDWLGRIHIGRYADTLIWKQSITNVGIRWLNNTPHIKVTDHTRLIIIDMLKGNYSKAAIQQWQEAALVLGISEHLITNDDPEVKDQVMRFLSSKINEQGAWIVKPQYVDGAILAYAVMQMKFIATDLYKKALDEVWEMIQEHIGDDGTVQYRKFMAKYRYVDTIGFICPFLVAYGVRYNKPECIELAVKQIKSYETYGMLHTHGIPCHAYDLDNKTPQGLYGWGRGLGWFAIGLIDAWRELPAHHEYKPFLNESIKKVAKAALRFQHLNGNWNWTVTREEARADSSATATMGWFMINAAQIPDISEVCTESAERAVSYLMKVTRRDGTVDFSQGDTKDIGVYSTLFNILPFTQGFSIRLMNFYKQEVS